MGWPLSRYLEATVYEFNAASIGYWIRWERNTAWLAREIMHMMISVSPDIKAGKKPSKSDLMKLNIDHRPKEDKNVFAMAQEYENKLKHGI